MSALVEKYQFIVHIVLSWEKVAGVRTLAVSLRRFCRADSAETAHGGGGKCYKHPAGVGVGIGVGIGVGAEAGIGLGSGFGWILESVSRTG